MIGSLKKKELFETKNSSTKQEATYIGKFMIYSYQVSRIISIYTGCAKMYPIFVLFISPVKIEIFQVCLFHIIGNFVFHPKNKIVSHIRMCE